MLKIVVNTKYDSAGTKVCVDDLIPRLAAAGHTVAHNDWSSYSKYDVALFMSPDPDISTARRQNHDIVIGICNPMVDYPRLQHNARRADFLVVGSLEQRDAQLRYNRNIFIYYMFPDIAPRPKKHTNHTPTIIGYHGNKEHLINFSPHITRALEQLARRHDIELWALYNISRHGRWTKKQPRGLKIKHIQWHPGAYHEHLAQCDIGIVNNAMPAGAGWRHVIYQPITRYLRFETHAFRKMDTITRFKYSTNAGRVYVFSQLNIPVIADFAPSMSQVIQDGHNGLIVNSAEGWLWAFEQLVNSPQLRQSMSDNLRRYIDTTISIDQNFSALNRFLIQQATNKKVPTKSVRT